MRKKRRELCEWCHNEGMIFQLVEYTFFFRHYWHFRFFPTMIHRIKKKNWIFIPFISLSHSIQFHCWNSVSCVIALWNQIENHKNSISWQNFHGNRYIHIKSQRYKNPSPFHFESIFYSDLPRRMIKKREIEAYNRA